MEVEVIKKNNRFFIGYVCSFLLTISSSNAFCNTTDEVFLEDLETSVGAANLKSVSDALYFNPTPDLNYRVKVYSQPYTHDKKKLTDAHVTFKYGDLINRAIRAKESLPEDNEEPVEIYFAIYKLARDVYIGINPNDKSSYGTVAGKDYGKDSTEKLVYSIIKAAKAGVKVYLLLQKGESSQKDTDAITNYLNDEDNWDGEYLSKRVNLSIILLKWGDDSDDQMHNKFMLLSHVKGDSGKVYKNCVYTSTANVDTWGDYNPDKKYYQSGVTVYDHGPLYQHYKNYFNIIRIHANKDQEGFAKEVIRRHREGSLNYVNQDDPYISAYFYPVSPDLADENGLYSPFKEMIHKLSNQPDKERWIKIHMAFFREDFWEPLANGISNADGVEKIDLKIKTHDDKGVTFHGAKVKKYKTGCKTHVKNYQFALYDNDNGDIQYYSITGSLNAKDNGFTKKANNLLVIKDSAEHPKAIYNIFKDMYIEVDCDPD